MIAHGSTHLISRQYILCRMKNYIGIVAFAFKLFEELKHFTYILEMILCQRIQTIM